MSWAMLVQQNMWDWFVFSEKETISLPFSLWTCVMYTNYMDTSCLGKTPRTCVWKTFLPSTACHHVITVVLHGNIQYQLNNCTRKCPAFFECTLGSSSVHSLCDIRKFFSSSRRACRTGQSLHEILTNHWASNATAGIITGLHFTCPQLFTPRIYMKTITSTIHKSMFSMQGAGSFLTCFVSFCTGVCSFGCLFSLTWHEWTLQAIQFTSESNNSSNKLQFLYTVRECAVFDHTHPL